MSDKAVGRIRCIAEVPGLTVGKEYEIHLIALDIYRLHTDNGSTKIVVYPDLDQRFERVALAPEKQAIAVVGLADERYERTVNGVTQYLTAAAQDDYDSFMAIDYNGCTCFLAPPCGMCVHPGNPSNLNADDYAWELPQQVHLGDGIFVTAADHEAIQKMDAVSNERCENTLCKAYLGPTRISAGLKLCTICSAAEMHKQASHHKLVQQGLDLDRANKIAYSRLTAHLREVKV